MKTITFLAALGILTCCTANEPIKGENNTEQTTASETDMSAEDKDDMNSENNATIELAGYVYDYNPSSNSGCFFVDKEMVSSGVAIGISGETSENCYSEKYGHGAQINFSKVPSSESYTSPTEGVLIAIKGYWNTSTKDPVFYVQSFEPFF